MQMLDSSRALCVSARRLRQSALRLHKHVRPQRRQARAVDAEVLLAQAQGALG